MTATNTTRLISAGEFESFAKEHVPLTVMMGFRIDSVGDGEAAVRAPYRTDYLRPGGTISGPVMMAAADLAMYGAIMSEVGLLEMAVTTNLNMNFLRRPPPGDVVARARLLKLGARLAVGEVSVTSDPTGALVAHATCTYSMPPRQVA